MRRSFTVSQSASAGWMKSFIWQHLSKAVGFLLIFALESLQFMQKGQEQIIEGTVAV